MSTRTTIILFLLVATLGAVILGIERYFPSAQQLREMRRGPARFAIDQVAQIEITDSTGGVIRLSLKDGAWQLLKPVEDLADPERVAALLKALDSIEWVERVERAEFDDNEWAKTGLDKPRHKIRVLGKAGQSLYECWFGSLAAIEGSSYIHLPGAEGGATSYVARGVAARLLDVPQTAWRDARLLRAKAERVTGITLTKADGQIQLFRENENMPWVLLKPIRTRASKDRVNELLSILLNIEIIEAKDATTANVKSAAAVPTPADAALAIPADEIRARLILGGDEKNTLEVMLKKPADPTTVSVPATAQHRKPAFTVAAKNIAALWLDPNILRDRLLAQINAEACLGMTITSTAFPEVRLTQTSGTWYLDRHGKKEPANGEKVARMIEALNSHEIMNYAADAATDLKPYGLDKPFQTLSWSYQGFKPIKLQLGSNEASTQFYAKYEDEPFVYRIDPNLLPTLSPDSIKWKGLGALRFSTFAVRRITVSLGAAPPLILTHNPETAVWKASQAGKDMTEQLDRLKVDKFASDLSKFTVQDWSASRSDALQALKVPYLRIQILISEEAGKNEGPAREVNLVFSPTQPNVDTAFLFGQIEGDPDVFYISRSSLLKVIRSPFKDKPGGK
ncbi:MAG: DUF4340 domain-containing protein [Verrucomicrobiaceae bacterium]|nr:DUF4340 domain-containing protein [Verrucomicrobiaceae bacterium]